MVISPETWMTGQVMMRGGERTGDNCLDWPSEWGKKPTAELHPSYCFVESDIYWVVYCYIIPPPPTLTHFLTEVKLKKGTGTSFNSM